MDATRQSPGGGRDLEEEIGSVLHILDTSLMTPPSDSDLVTPEQVQRPPLQYQQQPKHEQRRKLVTLQENEDGAYPKLGEVIGLMESLDANGDGDIGMEQQQQEQQLYNTTDRNIASAGLRLDGGKSQHIYNTLQGTQSTTLSSNYIGNNSISPAGLLNGPSMSPATINWLQTLVPSTSTESLTGLVSPATLFSIGANSSSSGSALADAATSGCLNRVPSCEIIDWKAYNESCSDKTQKEPAKWRVIPQHGPHADPEESFSVSTVTSDKLPTGCEATPESSEQQQIRLAAKNMADESNKRKALLSPEYVQYGNPVSMVTSSKSRDPTCSVKTEKQLLHVTTKVLEPSGRRPFKRSLHQTTLPIAKLGSTQLQQDVMAASTGALCADKTDDTVGVVCGAQCKCVGCANPFVPMMREGIDTQVVVHDVCLMQCMSKVKDMQELLDSTVSYKCCDGGSGVVQVKHTVENGFACPHCGAHFTYSWCNNRLCADAKKPRRHCGKCRRCGDHRNQHCDLCKHCYFAGVANSFRCSCQSSVSGSGKARTVPNPVDTDSGSIPNEEDGDTQNSSQPFGAVDLAVDNYNKPDDDSSTKPEEADTSCKMQ
uniref:Tesmin/TSO1-like CXC domain-containing protein n=1 Tax=Hyaloperonospora arabidopsidis (strain Emoy2) TaxID=559515 RepID=M4BAJ7_HYAAE